MGVGRAAIVGQRAEHAGKNGGWADGRVARAGQAAARAAAGQVVALRGDRPGAVVVRGAARALLVPSHDAAFQVERAAGAGHATTIASRVVVAVANVVGNG